jgi:hypothetical protein
MCSSLANPAVASATAAASGGVDAYALCACNPRALGTRFAYRSDC